MQWKNYRYNIVPEGVVITQYLEQEEECIRIPSEIDGKPVVAIGNDAFSEYGALLVSVVVPSTVKRICEGAFRMCMSLMELVLEDGVEVIEQEALYLTPMTELYLPPSVRYIGQPWELGNIEWKIDPKNPFFSFDGYGLYGIHPDESGCNMEKELLVVWQSCEMAEYAIAEGTTIIGENVLAGNNSLERVSMPASVHTICEAAFESCQYLKEVLLPEGLKVIRANAFSHCIRLQKIHLPASLEVLDVHAISDTFGWSESLLGLEEITVAQGNTHFEADEKALYEFGDHGDRYIVKYFGRDRVYEIPGDVSRILPSAFRRAPLYRFKVPTAMEDVGMDAFKECKNLEEIYLEESGTVLYVPQQPIYRKDEITALLRSEIALQRKREQPEEEIELPEKWKSFVGNAIYSRKQHPELDPYEEYVFDYRGYDALFHTYLNLPDHYGMACCRLKYPTLLNADVREKYEAFLNTNLSDILESLVERQDMEHLAALAELGFFTGNNIEDCMDVFNRTGQTKMLSYLLNYKRENLENDEFDFSL